MGATGEPGAPGNVWRSADDWPVPAREASYYLHADGGLSETVPTEEKSATEFRADPLHPNEIPGRTFPGAKDARPFEKQAEVRTFTTERLTHPVEWTGKVKAELYVSSSAKDTDFIVRVCDVYPDGRSILLMDYVRRARYRDGYDKEVFIEPGKIYKVAFDVGWISQIFNVGHRIRITVASTGAPFYEPNPNTGEPLTHRLSHENAWWRPTPSTTTGSTPRGSSPPSMSLDEQRGQLERGRRQLDARLGEAASESGPLCRRGGIRQGVILGAAARWNGDSDRRSIADAGAGARPEASRGTRSRPHSLGEPQGQIGPRLRLLGRRVGATLRPRRPGRVRPREADAARRRAARQQQTGRHERIAVHEPLR